MAQGINYIAFGCSREAECSMLGALTPPPPAAKEAHLRAFVEVPHPPPCAKIA